MKGQCNPLLDLSARPVIAHRGASGWAPENTMPAFELAARQGADAFELDVRLTRDGVPVVLHDAALDRTTDRSGLLETLTYQELGEVDAGYRFTPDRRSFPFRAREVRIPMLRQVLRSFPEVPLLLELKEPAAQESVRQVLLEERAVERCVLASEQHEALHLFREPPFATAASGTEIGALYRAVWFRGYRRACRIAACRWRYDFACCRFRPAGSWVPPAATAGRCRSGR